MNPPARSRTRVVLLMALAWAPFAVLWALFNIISFGAHPGIALLGGFTTIGSAALLSIGVWSMTRRVPWPSHVHPRFYVAHVAAALLYAFGWIVLSIAANSVVYGEPISAFLENTKAILTWRMLTGVWLYGMIAGVAYVIRMREVLRRQEQEAIRAQALASEAQLEALRARLNPHFFFNALHALSGLIHRDPDKADDALDRIGALLRRSLAADASRLVPLSEEWEFTSDYLDLERLRLGERLRVGAAIADEARACLVPPFTLQPVVENAVLHAVAPAAAGATIAVSAERRDGRLRLVVEDDGPGEEAAPTGREGHGLDLLRRRLEAHYGARASLEAGAAPAGGWRVAIELPAEEPGAGRGEASA